MRNPWIEYDMLAEHFAKRGVMPDYDTPLPANVAADVCDLISEDVEAFQDRVRLTMYAIAMESHKA